MSVDNNELLMLLSGKKKPKKTIGVAGQQGFGVGVYGGDEEDLTVMGLSPMSGCYNPASGNHGNYIHTNGSIMVFIPAFCYRIGNSAAPSYSRDTENALEVRDAQEFESFVPGATFTSANMGNGWILHRAFVDGGVVKRGFFIDKYLCSNQNGVAASVKGADWLMCYSGTDETFYTKAMGGEGYAYDAITLSRARGDQYSVCSIFQWSAISMLSLAHGQAATSASACAWYDSGYTTNFPKGATNSGGADANDSSLTFVAHSYGHRFVKTGTCSNFAKSTHNGQNNGVADVAGVCAQLTMGAENPSGGTFKLLKPSVAMHSITKDNRASTSQTSWWDSMSSHEISVSGRSYFSGTPFYTGTSGFDWSACGVIPKAKAESASTLFGADDFYAYPKSDIPIKVGLGSSWGSYAGVWCRAFSGISNRDRGYWNYSYVYFGFRASGYAG